jgi:anaerobic magnesium-protoporphyrin IX monomethyl ester cyclase
MNITLISLERELFCYGIRILSACLRQKGHNVKLIFLVPPETKDATDKFNVSYPETILDELAGLTAEDDLIGISLMTNQFIQAISVTKFLKSRNVAAPIIWGGIQPTVEPEECIEYADIICVGEGEEALMELAERMTEKQDYSNVRNLWFKTPQGIVRNQVRPLVADLNSLPLPDYWCENHFVAVDNAIIPLTKEKFLNFQGERFQGKGASIVYMTMTSRGCPFNCTYCANSALQSLYAKQKLLRWRSDENVVQELQMIQEKIAPISYVYFVDDNFTARPNNVLKAFCDLYKSKINVPYFAQVSPLTNSEEKMEILFNSGCSHVTMGVETASEKVAAIYNRSKEHKILPQAIALVEKYRAKMNPPPTYQFIIDNPYETLQDTLATLKMAMSFPRPWHNPIYSLMLFPGVPLYDRAMKDGFIKDKFAQIYGRNWRSQSRVYFQIWIRLYHANVSPVILGFLLNSWIARIATSKIGNAMLKTKIFRWLWIKY